MTSDEVSAVIQAAIYDPNATTEAEAVIAALAAAGLVIGERVELTDEQEQDVEELIAGEYVTAIVNEMGFALVRVVTAHG